MQYLFEISAAKPCRAYFCNIHTLFLASIYPDFKSVLRKSDLLLNDGIGLSLVALLQRGERFSENLVGTDLIPKVLGVANERGLRIFAISSQPATVKALLESGAALLGKGFTGAALVQCGQGLQEAARAILSTRSDLVLVGLGQPMQEFWIDRCMKEAEAKLWLGVGAFLDVFTGMVPRAPLFMRKCRLEWAFRLLWEPRRLWRRYLIESPQPLIRSLVCR